jgi:hypothetical protein
MQSIVGRLAQTQRIGTRWPTIAWWHVLCQRLSAYSQTARRVQLETADGNQLCRQQPIQITGCMELDSEEGGRYIRSLAGCSADRDLKCVFSSNCTMAFSVSCSLGPSALARYGMVDKQSSVEGGSYRTRTRAGTPDTSQESCCLQVVLQPVVPMRPSHTPVAHLHQRCAC